MTHLSDTIEKCENTFKRSLPPIFNPITSFGVTFFSRLCTENDDNLVMSPLSLWTALAMTEMATTDGCSAKSQLRDVLHYHLMHLVVEDQVHSRRETIYEWTQHILAMINVNCKDVQMSMANAIFCDDTIREEFEQSCEESFAASVIKSLQMHRINDFVSEKTKTKIDKIVSRDAVGPAVIISAAYFAADWTIQFPNSLSYSSHFTRFDGTKQSCTMMVRRDKKMMYKENSNMKIVQLSYGEREDLTASIILPNKPGKESMDQVIQQLFSDSHSWERGMRGTLPTDVHLELTKFEAKGGLHDIKTTMQNMKVTDVFKPGYLGAMTTDMNTHVGNISHKAVLTVDEKGTTAAAVTVVQATRGISLFKNVRVDRPFIFAITHGETSTLTFVARVTSMHQ